MVWGGISGIIVLLKIIKKLLIRIFLFGFMVGMGSVIGFLS